jgi:peptide/nickel transport system permease protein
MFLIPAVILGTAMAAATMRMTRTMMLEVLRQDYIRTAWSKGLRERVVIIRHTIKNALIPVVTRSAGLIGRAAAAQPLCGLQLPILVGGAVIMENIFNLPGLGRLLVNALNDRDYSMVSGVNLIFATGVVLLNLLVDLIYPYPDPKVRYE